MAIHKLLPRFVATVKEDGMHADGGGLYLRVSGAGKWKSWIYRYHVKGCGDRQMGLGSLDTIGLAEARDRAAACRVQRLDGIDPIEARKELELKQSQAASKRVLFHVCTEEWMERNAENWLPRTANDIKRRIERHLYPTMRDLPVDLINVDLCEEAIKLVQGSRPIIAELTREHLEGILDWARAKEYRTGDNPASLKGPLGVRLKPVEALHTVTHHPSLPYQAIGSFLATVRNYRDGRTHPDTQAGRTIISYILEFTILTAVRVGQVINMRWEEIDWERRQWNCLSHKTGRIGKAKGRPYIVLLSNQAIAILTTMQARQLADNIDSKYVFVHGNRMHTPHCFTQIPKKPYRGNRVNGGVYYFVTKRLRRNDLSIHGFRTTFSSWATDQGFKYEDVEMSLGHMIGTPVAEIYARDAQRIEARRKLMQAWANYCDRSEPFEAEIIPLRAQQQG
jgi:integrase